MASMMKQLRERYGYYLSLWSMYRANRFIRRAKAAVAGLDAAIANDAWKDQNYRDLLKRQRQQLLDAIETCLDAKRTLAKDQATLTKATKG